MTFDEELVFHIKNMKGYAMRLVKDRVQAEDLLQTVALKAMEYKDGYDSRQQMKAWLFTIMLNTVRSEKRRSWRWSNETDFFAAANDARGDNSLSFATMLIAPDRPDLVMAIHECAAGLMAMPKENRQPLLLVAAGFEYEEVAEKLNLNIGTVKSRVGRARIMLREFTEKEKHEAAY